MRMDELMNGRWPFCDFVKYNFHSFACDVRKQEEPGFVYLSPPARQFNMELSLLLLEFELQSRTNGTYIYLLQTSI